MFKKFLKNSVIPLIAVVLLVSCEGRDCIEANDFGEYDQNIVQVYANGDSCTYDPESEDGGGNIKIAECMSGSAYSANSQNNVFAKSTELNEIKIDDCTYSVENGGFLQFYDCYSNNICDGGEFKASGSDCTTDPSIKAELYKTRLELCKSACTFDNTNYGPSWSAATIKKSKGQSGITLSTNSEIYLQAQGVVTLEDSKEESQTFKVDANTNNGYIVVAGNDVSAYNSNDKELSGTSFSYFDNTVTFDVSGSVILSDGSTYGETGKSAIDYPSRYNFLRRGVVVLRDAETVENSNHAGLYPNANKWTCQADFKSEKYNCSSTESSFPLDDGFVKTIGGGIIPSGARNFILANPITTNFKKAADGSYQYNNENNTAPSEADKTGGKMTGYILNNENNTIKGWNVIYPSKVAYKVINLDTENVNSDKKCSFSITQTNKKRTLNNNITYDVLDQEADDKWHFVTDSNGAIVLNSRFNTLPEDFEVSSESGSSNSGSSNNYSEKYSLEVKTANCEKYNKYQIVVILIPQNELLMNKSGFIDFKKLSTSSDVSNSSSACADGYSCSSDGSGTLKFTIINPMYDYIKKNCSSGAVSGTKECFDLLDSNFYEYIAAQGDIEKSISSTPNFKSVNFNKGGWSKWEYDNYVRKGQILRFDDSTWFEYEGMGIAEFTDIKVKGNTLLDNANAFHTFSITDGLVMRIVERLDLICKGTRQEQVLLEKCEQFNFNIKNDKGEITSTKTLCKPSYTDICQYEENNELKYSCPIGCYVDNDVAYSFTSFGQIDASQCNLKPSDEIDYTEGCKSCYNSLKGKIGSFSAEVVSTGEYGKLKEAVADVVECYDLEDYKGSRRALTKEGGYTTHPKDSNSEGTNNTNNLSLASAGTYGDLTNADIELGAKKLASIFDNRTYGNLDGMTLNESSKDENGNYKGYNSTKNLRISSPKRFEFFMLPIIDENGKYTQIKQAEYKFTFTPSEEIKNGEQLAIVLANKTMTSSNPEQQDGFLCWVRKCDFASGKCENNVKNRFFKASGIWDDIKIDMSTILNAGNGYCNEARVEEAKKNNFENVNLYFAIVDPETKGQKLCSCKIEEEISLQEESACKNSGGSCTANIDVNSYYNNSGKYTVQIKTPKDSAEVTGYIVKYIMEPIINVLDGKTIGLQRNLNPTSEKDMFIECTPSDNGNCVYYNPADLTDENFGKECKVKDGDTSTENCYLSCSKDITKNRVCQTINNGKGFLQNFYRAVINDTSYQVILKVCFTLMICFYGMYYLLGMADLTHGELIRRLIKISFIYLMVGKDGWYYYNMFFVRFFKQGVDYLVFAIAGAFEGNASDVQAAFAKNAFYDKSVLFSGVDKNLTLLFSDEVSYKIWGLFFVSFFGWLYVFIIYFSIISYILAVANAMLLYLTAQFFVSMLLALGPIFFVMLVFEKTKEMFNKWINNLVSFSLEQIFLLTCLGIFNTLIYNIIKSVLSYRVCWMPVWVIQIPVLSSIELMSFWKATSATSPSAAAQAVPGLFQILIIYVIADLMKNFVEFSSKVGSSLGGGGITTGDMSGDISKQISGFYEENIGKKLKGKITKGLGELAEKTIGYETEEKEKERRGAENVARKKHREANRAGDKAARATQKKLLEENAIARRDGKEELSQQAINQAMAKARDDEINKFISGDKELQKALSTLDMSADTFKKGNLYDISAGENLVQMATMGVLSGIGHGRKFETRTKNVQEGKSTLVKGAATRDRLTDKYENKLANEELSLQNQAKYKAERDERGVISAGFRSMGRSMGIGARKVEQGFRYLLSTVASPFVAISGKSYSKGLVKSNKDIKKEVKAKREELLKYRQNEAVEKAEANKAEKVQKRIEDAKKKGKTLTKEEMNEKLTDKEKKKAIKSAKLTDEDKKELKKFEKTITAERNAERYNYEYEHAREIQRPLIYREQGETAAKTEEAAGVQNANNDKKEDEIVDDMLDTQKDNTEAQEGVQQNNQQLIVQQNNQQNIVNGDQNKGKVGDSDKQEQQQVNQPKQQVEQRPNVVDQNHNQNGGPVVNQNQNQQQDQQNKGNGGVPQDQQGRGDNEALHNQDEGHDEENHQQDVNHQQNVDQNNNENNNEEE